jgi:hypothetical protein
MALRRTTVPVTSVVVCHDAGGAEVVSSWLRRQPRLEDWKALLDGPAVGVFERKLPGLRTVREVGGRVVDLMLCGSSTTSDFEIFSWRMGQIGGAYVAVYLEHWKNYRARFETEDGLCLPDEVWVTDRWAADLAQRELPAANVLIKGNPYMEDVLGQIRDLDRSTRRHPEDRLEHVLYVNEPGREREFRWWLRHGDRSGQIWRERPHPTEREATSTLVEDVAWADVVVGCDSMAMAVAVRAGRRVISVLAPTEPLSIPYPGIERERQ